MKRFDSEEQMQEVFDKGEESILEYASISTAHVVEPVKTRRISMDMAEPMVAALDKIAEELAINRQAVIKVACKAYIDAEEERAARKLSA